LHIKGNPSSRRALPRTTSHNRHVPRLFRAPIAPM
jgi:hypothetical protein